MQAGEGNMGAPGAGRGKKPFRFGGETIQGITVQIDDRWHNCYRKDRVILLYARISWTNSEKCGIIIVE